MTNSAIEKKYRQLQDINLFAVQTHLHWEDAQANREHFELLMEPIEGADIILLPETFTTGFPVDPVNHAESLEGPSLDWMAEMAEKKSAAVCGSLLTEVGGNYYNSLIWMEPSGFYRVYHKRHVFTMGGEHKHIKPGHEELIVEYLGWRIKPLICYDLRFPVWSHNRLIDGDFSYDLLLYVANWPSARIQAWQDLLVARAIENQSYVAAVNRTGFDGFQNTYGGNSMLIDPKGKVLNQANDQEQILENSFSVEYLNEFRSKFKVSLDWDAFQIDV